MDILSDVLENVRLTGSVFYFADFREPWCIVAPPSRDYASMLTPGARDLVIFHIVVDGRCVIGPVDDEPVELAAGDAILLPRGDAHIMADRPGQEPTPVTELLPMPPWDEPPSLSFGGAGRSARLLCGYLHCADASLSPFLETLPRVMKVDGAGPLGSSLSTVRRLLIDQARDERPGSASVLARLTETFFIEALRRQISTEDAAVPRALVALRDPVVGKALHLMHKDPARAWTVDLLAHEVAMSRSLFASRFSALIGCPPMRYLTRWRLQIAARRLRERNGGIASVAAEIGYESEASFNRAFKRHVGAPPATWLGLRG